MIDLKNLRANLDSGMRSLAAESVYELIAITDRLQSELTAAHEQLGYNAKPNDSQDWSKISGAVAFHLIERHADDWREAGDMMEAFAASRAAARPAVVLSDEQIIEMAKQIGDLWGSSDDDWLIRFARAILAAEQAPADAGQAQALATACGECGMPGMHKLSCSRRDGLADAELPPRPALPETRYNGCGDGSEPLFTPEMMDAYAVDYARACMALHQPAQCAAPDEQMTLPYAKTHVLLNERPPFNPLDPCRPSTADTFITVTVPCAPPAPAAQPEAKAAPVDDAGSQPYGPGQPHANMQEAFCKRWAHPVNHSDYQLAVYRARFEGFRAGWEGAPQPSTAVNQAAQPEQQPVGTVGHGGVTGRIFDLPVGTKLYAAPVPVAAPGPLQGWKTLKRYDPPKYDSDFCHMQEAEDGLYVEFEALMRLAAAPVGGGDHG